MSDHATMMEIQRALGRIEAQGEAIKAHLGAQDQRMDRTDQRLDVLDQRLQAVEKKAAVSGATMGLATSVGMALVIEGAKAFFKSGGGR